MPQQKINNYKDLIDWQKSIELSVIIYELVKALPQDESTNLISQMKRSSVSISSNIAEGYSKGGRNYYRQFMKTTFASAAELESQLELIKKLGFVGNIELYQRSKELLIEVLKILTVMIKNMALSLNQVGGKLVF
jgi:four helix bundle protein